MVTDRESSGSGGNAMRTIEAVVARARAAKDVGRTEEAYRLLGAALLDAPDDPLLLEELADVCMASGRPADALRHAGRSIAVDPVRAGPYTTVALVYDMLGQAAEAERHARTALVLAPEDPGVLVILASTLVGQGRAALREEARALLDDWDNALGKFVKVMPRDYRTALKLLEAERLEAASVAAE